MKKIKASIIINIIIFVFVVMFSTFMFFGIKFMPASTLLESRKMEMFKLFTVDSNILMGISALIYAIFEIKLIRGKIKEIPKFINILKLAATSAITLTFIVTAFFLTPLYGFYPMYNNNNLFFHLIIPVLSIVTYVFLEKYNNKYKYALLGIFPTVLYSIFYTINVVIHLDNGGLTFKYDFYGFLRGNINNAYIAIPAMYLISFLITLLLIFLNKKLFKNK